MERGDLTRQTLRPLLAPAEPFFVTALVGVTSGCWVAYALVYPVSSLPVPRYSLVGVVVLGGYVDAAARSMLDRVSMVVGAAVLTYGTGFVGYAFPALVGWIDEPVVRRALYVSGLRRAFVFSLLATTLLLLGTFVAYVGRNTYAEFTR